jgi:tetratricopeptide (TPR) repeat protein
MILNKGAIVNQLKLMIIAVGLFSAMSCFADEMKILSDKEQTAILRETAQDWIRVGDLQLKKGQYEQAEKSLQAAKEYQEYLTAGEIQQLEKDMAKAHQAMIERQPIIEHLKKARELIKEGQPIKARAHYEIVRKSPYLTEQERKQIDREMQNVDSAFDKQSKEITDLYNRSVQLFRAGELEKARDGFVEVAKYGLLVVPRGQTAEDYLLQIDSILTEQLKSKPDANSAALPLVKEEQKPQSANQPAAPEITLLKPQAEKPPVEKQPQPNMIQEKKTEAPVESQQPAVVEKEAAVEPEEEAAADGDARAKIAQAYTKAVIDDAGVKVEYYIGTGEFDKALEKVRSASDVLKQNRTLIGDELFTHYTMRLKQLADNIIYAKKTS